MFMSCEICRTIISSGLVSKSLSICSNCLKVWKDSNIRTIIEDLKTGDPQIKSYECICGNHIYNHDECDNCGCVNLFNQVKHNIRSDDLKELFYNTIRYKTISLNTTRTIIERVFGSKLVVEGSMNKLKEVIDPKTGEVIITRTCNWQIMSSVFEYYCPGVIPSSYSDNIRKHLKEVYNTNRITNEDVLRIVSEYEGINPRNLILSKDGNKKYVINGNTIVAEGKMNGNKDLILRFLRSKMWDCPTTRSERKYKQNKEKEMNQTITIRKKDSQKIKKINIDNRSMLKVDLYRSPELDILKDIDPDTTPGDILRMSRLDAGLTQKDLGKILGLDNVIISKFETGRQLISEEVGEVIGEVLGIPSELLTHY